MTLEDLKPGQNARIESVDPSAPEVVRLMVLGMTEGAVICFHNAAIGGDPLEISIFGSSVSLRRKQARYFQISPIPDHV